MLFIRCSFCHRLIFRRFYPKHRAKHLERLPDGQQSSHITLQPGKRYNGSLDRVPQVYQHPECGAATRMPEQIIRSYLANPFLYGGLTFCTGCNDYVEGRELFWTETGESLAEYTLRLQQKYLEKYGQPPPKPEV